MSAPSVHSTDIKSYPELQFTTGFAWGAAASAQIEGAWNEDGRGPSIRDH